MVESARVHSFSGHVSVDESRAHSNGFKWVRTNCSGPEKRGPVRLDSSLKAYHFFSKHISQDIEEFWIAALDSGLKVREMELLFRGTADRCLIHPRDIFRFACLHNATSFVIAHNHPSGDPRPSREDLAITKRLVVISQMIEIPMNDHIILSRNGYFSFADQGLILRYNAVKSLRLRP